MSKSILVVDDNQAIVKALQIRLKSSGYQTAYAPNGMSGVAMAEATEPDAIVLDIRMPDIDGFEVNRRLKLNPKTAGIPVIFLSANLQEKTGEEIAESGVAYFFSKPYDPQALLEAIGCVTQS